MSKWKKKKLSEFCEFSNGLWTGKKPPFQKVGVIRNTNFTKDCLLDDSDIVYLDVEQSQFQKRKLKYGDIILEKSGGGPKQPVGRVVIFDRTEGDFSFSNFTSVIRIKNQEEVDFNFLHRYLVYEYVSGATEKMQSHSTGIRNLKFDEYKEIEIPLPPLPEQQRIVSILDECFAAIAKAKANAEQNLKNAKELFESYLQGVFEKKGEGWEETTLSELFNVKHGFAFQGEYFSNTGEYVLLTPGNFFEEGGYRDRAEKQKYYLGEIPKDFILKKGDLLVAMTEQAAGLLGSPIIVQQSNKFLHNQRLGLIVPKPNIEIDNEFFYHFFNLKKVRKALHDSGTGVKVRHTSPTKIGQIEICYPKSIKEQQTIVRQLDALRAETQKLEAVYQKKMADLEELKKSILQKALAGELRTEKALAI